MGDQITSAGAVYDGDSPEGVKANHQLPNVREAHDAEDHDALKTDPSHEDARADIALDEKLPDIRRARSCGTRHQRACTLVWL